MEKKSNKLYVEKESFEYNDKTYFSYCIKGKIRGKDVRIALAPPDKGGWNVLDIVFGNETKADLVVNPYEMKDDAGHVIKGNTYSVRTKDENGEVYECQVKPARISDKSLLNMLIK